MTTLTPNLAVLVPLAKLRPHPANPRTITNAAFERLKRALEADPNHLWQRPLAARSDGTVYCGNMRLLALQKLGWADAPVVYEDLPPKEEDLRRLRDNASYGEDDEDALAELLYHLKEQDADLTLTGYDDAEVSKLLDSVSGPELPADDADLEPPAEPTTKPGDLWLLGEHRLLCGDSTNLTDVERLMAGRKADMLWTDPPYGVEYVGKTRDALTLEGDGAEGLLSLLQAAFTNAGTALAPGAPFYVAHPAGAQHVVFWDAARAAGWQIHQELVWVKDSMVLGHADYHFRHEPILYGWMPGPGRSGRGNHTGSRWYGDHAQTSVLTFERPKRSAEHPTMKPPELVAYCLKNSSKRGDLVLDLFAGAGSTLEAAMSTERTAYLMEIDPRYADVIVRRWERLTGKTATLAPREE